ncbi:MAG: MMPL family transporter [Pseudomonadota bacterium]
MSQQRNALDAFATAFTKTVIAGRWLVILLSVVIAGYIATNAQKLSFTDNYRAFFSEQNPELRAFEDFQARFTKSDNILFVLTPKDGSEVFTNETMAAVGKITEQGWQVPFARRVDSLTNFQHTYANGDELIVEDLFETPGEDTVEILAEKRAIVLAEPLLYKQLVSESVQATGVNIVLNPPGLTTDEIKQSVAAVRAIREEIRAEFPHLNVYLTGSTMLSNAFPEAIATDFQTLIPLMILIIVIVTAIVVRSVSAMLSTVLIVILSAGVGMGWAGYSGVVLAGPSPSAVIVILTLAVADSIHILVSARKAMQAGMEKREAVIEAMRVNFLAVTITSITTIVGFMALNFSDSPPFRDFGNISAVGILAAWALSLTLLPAMLSLVPFKARVRTEQDKPQFMTAFANVVIGHYRVLFFGLGAATLALIAFIPTIELSDRFLQYFDQRIEFRRDSDKAAEYFGFYPLEYTIESGEPGGVNDPAYLETLDDFSNWLREQENVAHVYSIADIMKRLNKNLNEDDPDFYRLPDQYDLAAQYLLLYELSLPYGLDINDRIDIDKAATRLTATLNADVSTSQLKQLLKDSRAWFAENQPAIEPTMTGPQVMFTFIAQRNIESMVQGTTIAIVAIAVIMMIALRSVSIGLLSLAPNGMPILAAFGAWALLVGEVGFSVAAIASLSLGIVIDDTVHYLTKYVRARRVRGLSAPDAIRYAFETVGVAIIFNTLILGLGFAILTFSAFKINLELGLLTTLSIGFALVLDFLFLPALLMMTSRDKTSSTQSEPAMAT